LNPSHQHQLIGATESVAKALAPASSSVPATTTASTTATNDRPSAQNSAPTQPQPKIEKLNLKVLYAEDNLINQKVLKRVLERTGIQDITIVDNGKKAVDSCLETKYDVIFLDMQMPVMDGMEACDLIIKRDPTAKIVFVTAHALDQFRERAEAVGATSFISKPFRVGDITEVLKKLGKLC
jgi:CheY-like chemotaxis protein